MKKSDIKPSYQGILAKLKNKNLCAIAKGMAGNYLLAIQFYLFNSFITNFPSYAVRKCYLRKILGIKIGENTSIHMGCFIAGRNISIGRNTVVARKCYLDGRIGFIEIKNNVSIAPETYILSMTHDANSSTFEGIAKPIVIEDYVWLGARAMILPDVTLAKGCVVGAGAVVTKNVAEFTIVAGVPAKKIGERTKYLDYTLRYFPLFNTDISL